MNEPAVLVQVPFALQFAVPLVHSLTSVQVTPLPVKPVLQAQVNDPTVLVHVALALQFAVPAVHSFTSEHVTPLPL